jgi:hypothetical protein
LAGTFVRDERVFFAQFLRRSGTSARLLGGLKAHTANRMPHPMHELTEQFGVVEPRAAIVTMKAYQKPVVRKGKIAGSEQLTIFLLEEGVAGCFLTGFDRRSEPECAGIARQHVTKRVKHCGLEDGSG